MAKTDKVSMSDFDYIGLAHRLRVTRNVLGISVAQAAAAAECSMRTWRKYETTGEGRSTYPLRCFCDHFEVSLDWTVVGDGGMVRNHLSTRALNSVAILPAEGPWLRRAEQTYAAMGIQPGLKGER